jgi:hypothetical protein
MLNKNSGPPPVSGPPAFRALARDGGTVEVKLVETSLNRMFMAVGESTTLIVSVQLQDDLPSPNDFGLQITSVQPDNNRISVKPTLTSSPQDLSARILRYSATIAGTMPGEYSLSIDVPGLGAYTREVIVVEGSIATRSPTNTGNGSHPL